jgi:hypothetical protein
MKTKSIVVPNALFILASLPETIPYDLVIALSEKITKEQGDG